MSLLQDVKHDTLRTQLALEGHVNDLELLWLQALGATSGMIVDAWWEVFDAAAIPAGQFNDRAVAYIVSIVGAPPSDDYNAHWLHYWQNATLAPPVPTPPFPTVAPLMHWMDFADAGAVWQDAAGTIPGADGLPVGRVDNKGQDGANFVSGGSARPIWRTAALNGQAIGDFDHGGTFRRMQATSAAGSNPPVTGFTMAVVARMNDAQPGAAGQNELAAFSGNYRINTNSPLVSGRSDVTTIWPTGGLADFVENVNPYCPNQWYLFYVSVDPLNVDDFHYTSPGPEIPTTGANAIFPIPAGNTFGVEMISGDAHVAESFWWDGPLTIAERAALVSYVQGKYGVFAPGVCTYPQPPFQANLTHWWDFTDRGQVFQDTAGLVPVTSDNQAIQRINDKGVAADDLQDAGSSIFFFHNVVTGYPVARAITAQAAPRFTSQALATPVGGANGITIATFNRYNSVPGGLTKQFQIDNGPSNVSFETAFGSWSEEHQLAGTTVSNKVVVSGEWIWMYMSDGTSILNRHQIGTAGAAKVDLPQSYAIQAGTPVELDANQMRGEFAEILVYDRDLSAAEQLTLVAYFDAKYGVAPF